MTQETTGMDWGKGSAGKGSRKEKMKEKSVAVSSHQVVNDALRWFDWEVIGESWEIEEGLMEKCGVGELKDKIEIKLSSGRLSGAMRESEKGLGKGGFMWKKKLHNNDEWGVAEKSQEAKPSRHKNLTGANGYDV